MMLNRKAASLITGVILSGSASLVSSVSSATESVTLENLGRGCTNYSDRNGNGYAYYIAHRTFHTNHTDPSREWTNHTEQPNGQSFTLIDQGDSSMKLVAKVLDDAGQLRTVEVAFTINDQERTIATVTPESNFMYNGIELSEFTTPVRADQWSYNFGLSIASTCSTDGIAGAMGYQSLFYFGDHNVGGGRHGSPSPKYYTVFLGKEVK